MHLKFEYVIIPIIIFGHLGGPPSSTYLGYPPRSETTSNRSAATLKWGGRTT